MAYQWQPDIVVGVDFGMTCTGIAWSMGPEWPEPKTLQHWPGKLGHELRNKVDSSVSYDVHSGNLTTWGFLCNPDDERYEYNALFKLNLDPEYVDPIEGAPTTAEARAWYQDYLSCIYRYINKYFSDTLPRFAGKRIDFVFSVPVTWRKNPAMLAQIEDIIRLAGFGQSENERASVYLTEAEAAAIYAAKQQMIRGEVFLVCDAGGGTTDLNVLRVDNATRGNFELMPLTWTEGEAVGSTLIDWKIRVLVRERVQAVQGYISGDLDTVVSRMMQEKFDTFKCSFGSTGMDVPKLFMPIPGLQPGMDIPHAGIEDSKVVVTREELQAVFDDQVSKMYYLIDRQLQIVKERHPTEFVSYLVLSGGLGSSPYIQSRIKAKYQSSANHFHPDPGRMRVFCPGEPQLAVVHGLVMARIQADRGGPDMYQHRCCPISFGKYKPDRSTVQKPRLRLILMSLGILCRELYDPAKHQGEEVVLDSYDGQRWAERQIAWIIKQGQIVRHDSGACQRYRLKLDMGKEREPWKTRIVTSALPANQLPSSMRRHGAKEVCAVESILNPQDMKRKNRHWYNFGKEYNRAEFEVRLIVGTGLRFEIWSKNGVRSREHGEIEVQWEAANGSAPPMQHGQDYGLGIYRW